jgi:soluble lytic murein transglycosylase
MVRLPSLTLVLALVAAAAPLHAQSNAKARSNLVSQDDRFLAAREAFRVGQYPKVAEQASYLRGYVLEPYVEYYLLRMKIEEVPPSQVREFLVKHQGTYIANELRRDWLKVLVKRQDWEGFEAEYPAIVGDDPELTCYALQARWKRGDPSALEELRPAWMAPRDLPEGCAALAEAEIAAGKLTARHVWDRVRISQRTRRPTTARSTAFAASP